jgi:hypothetical protein
MASAKIRPEKHNTIHGTKIIKLTLFICFKTEYLSFATKVRSFGTRFEQNKIGLSPCEYDKKTTLQIVNHRFRFFML